MIQKNIFLYHLDNELEKLFSLHRYDSNNVYSTLKMVTRVAFLLCKDHIYVPASNYFESNYAFQILNELLELREINAIKFVTSSYNIDDLLNNKKEQYSEDVLLKHFHYGDFLSPEKRILLPGSLVKKKRSASIDIKNGWYQTIGETSLLNDLFPFALDGTKVGDFEDSFYSLPHRIGKKAYISEHMLPLLPLIPTEKTVDYKINKLVTQKYIESFLKEYDAICIKNIPIIDDASIIPQETSDHQHIPYNEIVVLLKSRKFKGYNLYNYILNCTCSELIEYKYSTEGKLFIQEFYETTSNSRREKENMNCSKIKIGIITALPEECAAMKTLLNNVEEVFFDVKGAGHRFFIGEIESANKSVHKVVLSQCGMGNNKAAIRASNMLMHFPFIDSIIMTGIAAGIPCISNVDKHPRLGDVVISSGVTQYDFVKETQNFIECRSTSAPPSAQLTEAVKIIQTNFFENKAPWNDYIFKISSTNNFFKKPAEETDKLYDENENLIEHPEDPHRTTFPKIFFGNVASANTLLKNPQKREQLQQEFGAIAVEMEASGIADATWEAAVGYIVIRGICDYGDSHKNDIWHNYAALTAAAFTKAFIETLPCFE